MKDSGYKIASSGAQVVKGPRVQTKKGKGSVKTGDDLRSGKGK